MFIQYSCFPQDRVQARVQHVVSVFLQLFVVKIQIWPSQKGRSLIWSVITIFHISFAVTPSNAQPHTRPPMRINVPHHTSELHYFILHNMWIICCSHRSNSRTVCEEAKPTYHGYGTPKCHQEPKQDCKQVFFLTLQANLTNCHNMAVTSNWWCYNSKQVAKQTPSESCKQVKMIYTEAQTMTRII